MYCSIVRISEAWWAYAGALQALVHCGLPGGGVVKIH